MPPNSTALSHYAIAEGRPAPLSSTIDVSIVLVTYKAKAVVADCLRTLLRENGLVGLNYEIVLVDNASGDGVGDRVRTDFPEVRVMENAENLGFSRANNVGIATCSGRNILLLNPDTLVPPGAIKKCVDFLDAQLSEVGAMTCRVQSVDTSLQWTCSRRLITPWSEICRALLLDRLFPQSDYFNPEPDIHWDRSNTRDVECLLGAFMLIRRSVLERIGGLDERFFLMYEDVDWCKRACDAGYRLVFWPGAFITHIGGASWKQEPIVTFANSHRSAMEYIRKHHPAAVGRVLFAHRLGMELKILALKLNLLRKPGDEYSVKHLEMARAARVALKVGSAFSETMQHAVK